MSLVQRAWLWGPVAACIAVRLVLFLAGDLVDLSPEALRYDAIEYHGLGASLASGGGFQMADFLDARNARYDPELLRMPGYPLVVAAVYALVGPHPGAVLLLQIGIDAATCAFLAGWLRPTLGRVGASAAALAVALHPASALYACMLLSETLLVAALVAACAASLRASEGRAAWALAAGALWGVAALVKPVALWAPLPVVAVLVGAGRRTLPVALRQAALTAVGCGLVLAPWVAWNGAVRGTPMMSTSSAYNALALYAAPVVAEVDGLEPGPALVAVEARAEQRAQAAGVAPRSDLDRLPFWSAETADVLRSHPATVVRLQARGMVRSFVSIGRGARVHLFGEPPPQTRAPGLGGAARWWVGTPLSDRVLDIWALAYLLVAYPLLAAGAWWTLRRRREAVLWVGIVLTAYLLTVTGIPGHSRFMVPAVPFWAPLVGVAVARLGARGAA